MECQVWRSIGETLFFSFTLHNVFFFNYSCSSSLLKPHIFEEKKRHLEFAWQGLPFAFAYD